jgi:hypothetical protein
MFTGMNVKAAPAVHDALTSIESVQAPTPIYNLDESSTIQAQAFADAAQKARQKFADQCVALNIDPKEFYPLSWSIQDQMHQGKTLSFKEPESPKAVGLEPGRASVDITVTFAFLRHADSKK